MKNDIQTIIAISVTIAMLFFAVIMAPYVFAKQAQLNTVPVEYMAQQ